jgi:DNA-binding CsgD family transcriptional regulator
MEASRIDLLRAALQGYELQLDVIKTKIAEISHRIIRTRRQRIACRKRSMPARRGRWGVVRLWSPREIERLRELYAAHRPAKVAEILGRSVKSVLSKAKVLRLGKRKFWSAEELQVVRELYADRPTSEIAEKLGRSVLSVYQAADKLGLRKTAEYMKTVGLQKGSQVGAEFRFPKGHVPANKGVRRPGWAAGRMTETQFRKGHRPHTWKPVGTVLPDHEGYLRIKVKEHGPGEHGWCPTVWPLVHHLVWTEAHGPVPEGHAIGFRDGDRNNCAIGNLECVSRGELAKRNAMWNRFPQELIDVILLNGALKRKLRRMSNGQE